MAEVAKAYTEMEFPKEAKASLLKGPYELAAIFPVVQLPVMLKMKAVQPDWAKHIALQVILEAAWK